MVRDETREETRSMKVLAQHTKVELPIKITGKLNHQKIFK